MASCLSFVITLAISIFLLPQDFYLATAIILMAVAIIVLIASFINKRFKNFLSLVIFSLIAISILIIYDKISIEPINALKGTTANISGTVTSSELSSNGNTYYTVKLNSINGKKSSGQYIRLYCTNFDNLCDYDKIEVEVSFFKADSYSSQDLYYLSNNITATAISKSDITVTNKEDFCLLREICSVRDKMIFNIRTFLKGETGEIICGILFGKRDYISGDTTELFSKAGISHLLCVSGLHLSILSAVINFSLILLFIGKKTRTVFTFIFIAILVIMIGFTPSIIRSAIMTSLILIAQCIRRDYDAPTAISLSAFLICLFNPYAISNIGFLLSFSATAGLTLSNGIILNLRRKFSFKTVNPILLIGFEILRLVLPCFFAFLFTIPISICVFNSLSVYSVIINLIISPLLTPLLATAFFGAVFSLLPFDFISSIFLFVAEKLTDCVTWISNFFSSLPYSQLTIKNDLIIPITFLIILIFSILIIKRCEKRKLIIAVLLCVPIICTSTVLQHKTYQGLPQISIADSGAVIIKNGENTFISGFSKENSYAVSKLCGNKILLISSENASGEDITALTAFVKDKDIKNIYLPNQFKPSIKGFKANALYDSFNLKATGVNVTSKINGKNSLILYNIDGFKIAHLNIKSDKDLIDDFNCDLLIANSTSLLFLDKYKANYFILSEQIKDDSFIENNLKNKGILYVGDNNIKELYLKEKNLYLKRQFSLNSL